jgi:hypothetical protein
MCPPTHHPPYPLLPTTILACWLGRGNGRHLLVKAQAPGWQLQPCRAVKHVPSRHNQPQSQLFQNQPVRKHKPFAKQTSTQPLPSKHQSMASTNHALSNVWCQHGLHTFSNIRATPWQQCTKHASHACQDKGMYSITFPPSRPPWQLQVHAMAL